MTELPLTQLVSQTLIEAGQPLTVAEILARVEAIQPLTSRNPKSSIRNAIGNANGIASLGGRPAHYVWWPQRLADNVFRLPLIASDLSAGTMVLLHEIRMAMWPDFYNGPSRSDSRVTLLPANGPEIESRIELLGHRLWGIPPTPALAEWYHQQAAISEDEVIIRVIDSNARRFGVSLSRTDERDEVAIAARNRTVADTIEAALRSGRSGMIDSYLMPRLIGHGSFQDDIPPDPIAVLLRSDLRFVDSDHIIFLVEKVVDDLEDRMVVAPDPHANPRPRGDRRKARSDKIRQAWAAYLFDRGMDHLWVGWEAQAEAYYKDALSLDPDHADAWVHLGNRRFAADHVAEALTCYKRSQVAAERRTIGDPDQYGGPFWGDVDSRPYMRALHGQGLCLWRLGYVRPAREVFSRMMALNPNDNQGSRFLVADIDEGLTWAESIARDEANPPGGKIE